MMRIQGYSNCTDKYKYKCKCGYRASLRHILTHYCPDTVSIGTYARIVFDYFVNGTNAVKLVEKVAINHKENLSVEIA